MRCLHCGKRLTILRKLSDDEFCSEAHRAAFGREQEQLALSRLIAAQQQSQQVPRRREKEKKKPAEVPAIEAVCGLLAEFVEQMPAAVESAVQDRQELETGLLLELPDVCLPRLGTAFGGRRMPVGESVWPAVRVEALSGKAGLVGGPAEASIEGAAWSGNHQEWVPDIQPDFSSKSESRPAPVVDPEVPEAGVVAWPDAVRVRNWFAAAKQVSAEPLPPENGWEPEAFPPAGLHMVAAESGSGPTIRVRFDSMIPVTLPAPRREPGQWQPVLPVAEWRPAKAFPAQGSLTAKRMPMAGCLRLSLERLACGSYRKIEFCEPPAPFPAVWTYPGQGRPRTGRLLLAGRVPILVPQADWGQHLTDATCGPESLPAFLAPPRCGNLPPVTFEPPMYGLRQDVLSARGNHDLEAWRHHEVNGPFVAVPSMGARPTFSAPLLCDWVPIRARMIEPNVEIAPRAMAAVTADGEQALQFAARSIEKSALPSETLQLRDYPSVRSRAESMRRITLDNTPPRQSARDPKGLLTDEPLTVARVLPLSRLRPVKDPTMLDIEHRLLAPAWKKNLLRAVDAWEGVPGLAKVSGALMAVMMVVFATVPGITGDGGAVQATVAGRWEILHRNILDRAAVALTDDFRAGLADWEGEGEWARTWSYDQSGFVRTGPLALYSPSLELTNYRMEFLGQIEKRSIGWVVRAADARNYYAVKLVVADAGPVPEVLIQRYPVIAGRSGPVIQKRLPLQVRMDTLYRVRMEVRDNDYWLSVQDGVVDSWSEPALRRGGIGFFSGKGELARVRWVGVWHQYDTLGRLCALLAPQGIADRDRGASQ